MALTVASIIVISVICFGILYMAIWHFRRRHLYKLASRFPGPPVLPFIGNAHLFFGNGEHILSKISELTNSYPSLYRVWFGPRLFFTITDPEQAKVTCLSPKTLGKSFEMDFLRVLFGTGILTAPVSKWKMHRKLIQPTFNTEILNTFVEIFAAQSNILSDQMKNHLDGPEFEIYHLISLCTLDMVCETTMGVNVGAQSKRNLYHLEATEKVIAGFNERVFSPWLHPDCIFYLTQVGRNERKYVRFLHDFVDKVIKTKKGEYLKSTRQPGLAENEDDAYNSPPRRKAFLDHLIAVSYEGADLSDEAIRDEAETMMVAGNESSAITMAYVMAMLASHPSVQEKAYQELYGIYGDRDTEERPVIPEDLPRMKYLERVIKETLRLFPVAVILVRTVEEDLKIGEHTLPAGSTAGIGILSIHRNGKYWPDPLRFDPDRFLPEEVAKRHPYAFLGFSGGPRNCVGLNYALMSTKTLLATVLRRYILKKDKIVPVKDIRLKMEILMKPVDPIKIRIERRTGN